jgi:hypothetical protein
MEPVARATWKVTPRRVAASERETNEFNLRLFSLGYSSTRSTAFGLRRRRCIDSRVIDL